MVAASLNPKKGEFEWPLVLPALGLGVIGVLFIFSATAEASQGLPLYKQTFFLQIVWFAAGVGAAVALCLVDYGKLARWSAVAYWGMMIPLAGVLVLGVRVDGGKRWINLGAVKVQPSEFAKIAFIFLMAEFLSRPVEELRQSKVFFKALGYTALPFVLIVIEPDLGSGLVLLSVWLAMMFVAGVPNRFLVRMAAWVCPLIGAMLTVILLTAGKAPNPPHGGTATNRPNVMANLAGAVNPPVSADSANHTSFMIRAVGSLVKPYQQARLVSFFGLGETNQTKVNESYQSKQALISVGSGGWWGAGYRQGTQHELGFLPKKAAHNDFIFSVIAEEEGFVGSVAILALYSVLLFSGIKVASQARDRLGKLLAVGVVTLLFSHVFINIGMNIHLMPVTGIPLPLLSYGGSSVVCSLIAIGILHNVHVYRKSY
jgi:rod shape determining protein RodA